MMYLTTLVYMTVTALLMTVTALLMKPWKEKTIWEECYTQATIMVWHICLSLTRHICWSLTWWEECHTHLLVLKMMYLTALYYAVSALAYITLAALLMKCWKEKTFWIKVTDTQAAICVWHICLSLMLILD